ncbi:WhiB family transcriptional regulator [Streptomyces nodosus]|uniref:WhiB family transcriptional regulator n=1 Tax=Streptomyces nodosus TaxID=40318 RepID=UPI0034567982
MELVDPERKWRSRGICKEEDDPLFFADGGIPLNEPAKKVQAKWDQAKEVCANCPVLAECRRDTLGEEYGVWGGLDQHERWKLRGKLYQQAKRWPKEERLAWGKLLAELRNRRGMILRDITTRTGIGYQLAPTLIEEWEEHRKAQAALALVPVTGEAGRHKPDFPDRPGQRDAWVRHDTVIADGWYISQTPDGKWFRFTCFSGRGNVRKWFRAEDALIYQYRTPVVVEYAGRPDEPGEPVPLRLAPARAHTKTHCPKGHALTEANARRISTGYRVCRACERERSRDNRKRGGQDAVAPALEPQLKGVA